MDETIKFITKSITELKIKSPFKIIVFVLIILSLYFIIFPLFFNNHLFFSQLRTKTEITKMLSEIPISRIEEDSQLKYVYNSTIEEVKEMRIQPHKTISLNNYFSMNNNGIGIWKFLSGSSVFLLLGLVLLFQKKENFKKRIINFSIILVIGVLSGLLALIIPVFYNLPGINYIGYPVLLLSALIFFSLKGKK
ncbi:MAG: hypothetical protein WC973_03670 [Candidatus Dojkabacteria bacterium]